MAIELSSVPRTALENQAEIAKFVVMIAVIAVSTAGTMAMTPKIITKRPCNWAPAEPERREIKKRTISQKSKAAASSTSEESTMMRSGNEPPDESELAPGSSK